MFPVAKSSKNFIFQSASNPSRHSRCRGWNSTVVRRAVIRETDTSASSKVFPQRFKLSHLKQQLRYGYSVEQRSVLDSLLEFCIDEDSGIMRGAKREGFVAKREVGCLVSFGTTDFGDGLDQVI
jgi:hypothetical protein